MNTQAKDAVALAMDWLAQLRDEDGAGPPADGGEPAIDGAPPAGGSGDVPPAAPPPGELRDLAPAAPPAALWGDPAPAAPPAALWGDPAPAAPPAADFGDATPPAAHREDVAPAGPPAVDRGEAHPAAPSVAGWRDAVPPAADWRDADPAAPSAADWRDAALAPPPAADFKDAAPAAPSAADWGVAARDEPPAVGWREARPAAPAADWGVPAPATSAADAWDAVPSAISNSPPTAAPPRTTTPGRAGMKAGVEITERAAIGDELRIPLAWCEMGSCISHYADPAALGEADIRARAIAAGWRVDALRRLACPRCQQGDSWFWTAHPVALWDRDTAVAMTTLMAAAVREITGADGAAGVESGAPSGGKPGVIPGRKPGAVPGPRPEAARPPGRGRHRGHPAHPDRAQ
jgi:hypothetical protein